jgi:hypothetical protein
MNEYSCLIKEHRACIMQCLLIEVSLRNVHTVRPKIWIMINSICLAERHYKLKSFVIALIITTSRKRKQ